MTHWQIKLIDWRYGKTKWHGYPDQRTPYKIIPYIYDNLEDARYIKSTMTDAMKTAYDIRIIKITPKKTRKKRKR